MADSKENVYYTLKRHDHLGYKSLYLLYLSVSDPSEYQFAIQHLDGWEHWEILRECSWFKPYLASWRSELAAKLESESYHQIKAISLSGTENAKFVASRYLLDRAEKPAGALKRGRPSKVALQAEIASQASLERKLNDDFLRVKGTA